MEKQQQVEKLLTEILSLMEYPARLDFKDAADGSLAVAMHFTEETPQGITAGKKSYLVDSLQFLLNKCINRPNVERRWVTLGVGGFPEPRGGRPAPTAAAAPGAVASSAAAPIVSAPSAPSAPRVNPPRASAPMPATNGPRGSAAPQAARPPRGEAKPAGRPGSSRPQAVDEATLEFPDDPLLTELGVSLAQKSAQLGRIYAVAMMSVEDRSRILKAARTVTGVAAKVEGESHFRRLAFTPEKPTPMPKRHAMAVYPDDEEEGE